MSERARCHDCPVAPAATCLGAVSPRFAHLCDFAASGDPLKIAHVINRSAIGVAPAPPESELKPPLPGPLRTAANFAGAAMRHAAAGMPDASPEVAASRLAICRTNACGFYRVGDRCAHANCGCFLQVKTRWQDQHCPIGLW
jgi:hypothetical protein